MAYIPLGGAFDVTVTIVHMTRNNESHWVGQLFIN